MKTHLFYTKRKICFRQRIADENFQTFSRLTFFIELISIEENARILQSMVYMAMTKAISNTEKVI